MISALCGAQASEVVDQTEAAGESTEAGHPSLDVQFPGEGAVVRDSVCGLFVAGRSGFEREPRDLIVAIDVSRSTVESSGADIDGDGELGRPGAGKPPYPIPSTDPQDSILAAEVEAARSILAALDYSVDRAGVVTFSGSRRTLAFWSRHPAAQTVAPLTGDREAIRAALEVVASVEPHGGTNLAAAIDEAISALTRGSRRDGRAARALVYVFTDGEPTLPMGPEHPSQNVRVSLEAVERAASAGVRIDSFAIGREALEGPIVPVEMAARTGGEFTPVRHPGDLRDLIDLIQGSNPFALDRVTVRNETTGRSAQHLITRSDRSWAGFVPVAAGENRIEVVATSADGRRAARSLVMYNDDSREPTPIPDPLRAQRDELLEDCLRSATRRRLKLEDQARERLVDAMRREREAAHSRSREQRRRLDLEVEPSEGD